MKSRSLSLDFLRGVSIFGMIFSAIVPSGVLPAWMYHIQNPPPFHALDTSVSGIGWVDLVFPVFIFCMGVAIPLSGQKKIGQGVSAFEYIKSVLGRFFMLWLFSYLYVLMNFTTAEGIWPQIFTILGFFALFPLYKVLDNGEKRWDLLGMKVRKASVIRCVGILLVLWIIAVGHFEFGEAVNMHRRGIIIFLLAFLYLFGSLIWYFTRNNAGKRVVFFALLVIFVHVTRILEWPSLTYADPNLRWWFNMEYFYFLLVLVPATLVGDMLCKGVWGSVLGRAYFGRSNLSRFLFPSLLLFVIWQCIALYMNLFYLNMAVALFYFVICWLLFVRYFKEYGVPFLISSILLVFGLFFIPIEGGISKVPCTVGYCLVTCGMAMMLFIFSDYLCAYCGDALFVRLFAGAGRNPLMSYIAFGNFIMPFMTLSGAILLYKAAYPDGYHLIGVLRAAAAVLFTMWTVFLAGKKKIYWKA